MRPLQAIYLLQKPREQSEPLLSELQGLAIAGMGADGSELLRDLGSSFAGPSLPKEMHAKKVRLELPLRDDPTSGPSMRGELVQPRSQIICANVCLIPEGSKS